jgi:hypothetical protein
MNRKFKINCLQNDTYIIVSKLEESIPKGIILYYSLVFILDRLFSDKEKFASFPFFSFLKKIKLLYRRFFGGLRGLGVYTPHSEGFEGDFLRPVQRPARPPNMSIITNYSQEKLSRPKIQNRRNFVAEYYRQKSSKWRCLFFVGKCKK